MTPVALHTEVSSGQLSQVRAGRAGQGRTEVRIAGLALTPVVLHTEVSSGQLRAGQGRAGQIRTGQGRAGQGLSECCQ